MPATDRLFSDRHTHALQYSPHTSTSKGTLDLTSGQYQNTTILIQHELE